VGLSFGLASDSLIAPTPTDWSQVLDAGAFGSLFVAAGVYFFRLDPKRPARVSRNLVGDFLRTHRRGLKVLAQVGVAVSILRFGVACVGASLGRWSDWTLEMGAVALWIAGHLVWESIPERLKQVEKAQVAFYAVALLVFAALKWISSHQHIPNLYRFAQPAGLIVLYALDNFILGRWNVTPLRQAQL